MRLRMHPVSNLTNPAPSPMTATTAPSILSLVPGGYAPLPGVPDEMMGEKVGATIVLHPGQEATASEIREFAGERLAGFKVPQYITFRTEPLPRNAGGKVLKPSLRKETDWGDQLR